MIRKILSVNLNFNKNKFQYNIYIEIKFGQFGEGQNWD